MEEKDISKMLGLLNIFQKHLELDSPEDAQSFKLKVANINLYTERYLSRKAKARRVAEENAKKALEDNSETDTIEA